MYYPKARFVDNVEDQELIARAVPFGRLGRPEEAGALIVSGKRRSRRCRPRENRKVTESAGRIKERTFSFSPSGRFSRQPGRRWGGPTRDARPPVWNSTRLADFAWSGNADDPTAMPTREGGSTAR
jgi:hypothetical protein